MRTNQQKFSQIRNQEDRKASLVKYLFNLEAMSSIILMKTSATLQ
jgi:hypothetical protein